VSRDACTEARVHGALPAAGAGGVRAGPPPRHIDVQDEVRRLQPAALVQQPAKDGGRDGERRVGHDVERSPGESEVGGVGPDEGDVVAEPLAQCLGAPGVSLDGDDPGAGGHQRSRERAEAGADVQHQVTGADARGIDDAFSPGGIELVPAPPSP